MTDSHEPIELTGEQVDAVSGGNGYFGSGHRDGSVMGSGG